jgi:thiamine-monophosphate kinase
MPAHGTGNLGDLGEFGLVSALIGHFPSGDGVSVGPGDDAAVVAVPGAEAVWSLDMLVQNRHFRLDWSAAADVGHKAAAANLSDINAMGGRATAMLVGFAAPPDLQTAWAMEFADGLAAEAELVGASVVGGDVTRADVVTVAVAVLGVCEHQAVRRSGAQPGDVVALAGRQGWADAGFAVLGRGFRSPRVVVDSHRRPTPPYDAGPLAARLGATSMIDVSDGLLQDVGQLATASSATIDLQSELFDLPEPLQAVGAALGVDPLRFVLTGGDDYSLVATFPPEIELPSLWRAVGTVAESADAPRVTVDGESYPDPQGHEHFV